MTISKLLKTIVKEANKANRHISITMAESTELEKLTNRYIYTVKLVMMDSYTGLGKEIARSIAYMTPAEERVFKEKLCISVLVSLFAKINIAR